MHITSTQSVGCTSTPVKTAESHEENTKKVLAESRARAQAIRRQGIS